MSKESITFVAQNGAVDDAGHIAARGDFNGGDANLIAVAICVCDCGAVNNAVETGPESGTHAHGAGFTGCVERITIERKFAQAFGCLANGADFSMGARVEFLGDGI